jgi:hypothetical protein
VTGAPEARLARVRCVVAAGRRAADPADPIGREARAALLESSGLSREGVELALTKHLETCPLPEHLAALIAAAGVAPRCHVVLAANVCTAALRALAVAVATAPLVCVRPSRRDPALAPILARVLAGDPSFAAAGGAVACVAAVDAAPGDELHIQGSDAAIRTISASAAPGVIVRGHGPGLGVAVVGSADALDAAARAVAGDVIPFDQRGCLSPRVVLVEGDAARAEVFADALHRALADLSAAVPRGPLDDAVRAEIALYRASLQAVGALWEGPSHFVGLDPTPRALAFPPAARVVHVVPACGSTAPALIAPWARYLTAIGDNADGALCRGGAAIVSDLGSALRSFAPRARRARLGEMQRPPLDGPVDLRLR